MTTLSSLWQSSAVVPEEHRRNFINLYLDIAWYGVLSGSAISFMAVYATRLGASAWEIGLLNAAPAIVSLAIALPAGQWLQARPISRTVFWTSVLHRVFYVPWIFLPLMFAGQAQVWALIGFVFLMSIPGTALAVGFNALFAAAVPPEWRGHVVGLRNAWLAATFIATSLLAGWLLNVLPFPVGYQVVFGIGALGAAMSSLHLWFVRPSEEYSRSGNGRSIGDMARPGLIRTWAAGLRGGSVEWRFLARPYTPARRWLASLSRGYVRVVAILFLFHLAQFLAIPLFPLYWVNNLHLTDAQISLGNAIFYATVLLGSLQLGRLTQRWGNQRLMVVGVVGMSAYPALMAITHGLPLFLVTSAIGGVAWSLVGGASANYLLERIPEDRRTPYLAWYNVALNAAVLLGALLGPALAEGFGLVAALLVAAVGRFVAAVFIARWG